MPLYLCRWPNGDCSFVQAATKGEAIELLDEIANAEGCPLTSVQDFMVHFHLTDSGELVFEEFGEITEDAFEGHTSMVFFGFNIRPEICSTTLAVMHTWLKALGDEGKNINAYFVTIDPERDTTRVMKDYVMAVSDRIVGITGEPAKVLEMSKGYGIYSAKVPLDTRSTEPRPAGASGNGSARSRNIRVPVSSSTKPLRSRSSVSPAGLSKS